MTGDENRIAHLMGEPSDALDEHERDELDGLMDLLADKSTWAVPPSDLEDRVVQAVRAEASASSEPPVSTEEPSSPAGDDVVDLGQARSRRAARRWPIALGASVAAAAVIVGAVLMAGSLSPGGGDRLRFETALSASGPPGPSGSATLTRTDAGWEVVLDAKGLPRLDTGRYYQAWLKNTAGVLVPLGSFNEGGRIILWSGVSPVDFPTFTVTAESADGNQASSGVKVLAGTVDTAHPQKG